MAAKQAPRGALRASARQLAEEHPDTPGARLFLGLTLAQVGDLDGASREYKESARLAPDDPFPHYFHGQADRKSTRLNSSHGYISYAVFCLKKKKTTRSHHHACTPPTREQCPQPRG